MGQSLPCISIPWCGRGGHGDGCGGEGWRWRWRRWSSKWRPADAPHQGPRLSRTRNTLLSDAGPAFPRTWAGQQPAATMKPRCAVYYIEYVGREVSFAYQPEVRLDVQTHRTLHIPPAFVNSTDICALYHELCRRIYEADQSSDAARPEDRETDVCLWITPYVEIRMERNMNGVMERRVVKGSRRGRLRNRTLFVKWMLECSDWQEQLARNFWGLPKRGVGRDVTLPWFSLEVEYRPSMKRNPPPIPLPCNK